jgi:uncharacterized protein YkwD
VPAHRKPTHRPKIVAAALGTALACSGVAFAVQVEQEPVSTAPEPLTATSAPSSPTSSSAASGVDERDVRPSRSARTPREKLAEKREDRTEKTPQAPRTTPEPTPEPEEIVETPTPTPDPEPTKTAAKTTEDAPEPNGATTSGSGILGGTNAARANAGLAPLSESSCLTDLAQRHAERLAASQTLQHQDLGSVMSVCGMSAAAENVAMNYSGPSDMVRQWLNSSGHRANLLSGNYSLIGIGAAQARDGSWYGVQVFGAS